MAGYTICPNTYRCVKQAGTCSIFLKCFGGAAKILGMWQPDQMFLNFKKVSFSHIAIMIYLQYKRNSSFIFTLFI